MGAAIEASSIPQLVGSGSLMASFHPQSQNQQTRVKRVSLFVSHEASK